MINWSDARRRRSLGRRTTRAALLLATTPDRPDRCIRRSRAGRRWSAHCYRRAALPTSLPRPALGLGAGGVRRPRVGLGDGASGQPARLARVHRCPRRARRQSVDGCASSASRAAGVCRGRGAALSMGRTGRRASSAWPAAIATRGLTFVGTAGATGIRLCAWQLHTTFKVRAHGEQALRS
jgi:hypothetical protein